MENPVRLKTAKINYLKFIKMKNLFFALAFMLVGTFAFANDTIEFNNLESVKLSNQVELTLDLGDLTNKTSVEINNAVSDFIHTNLSSVDPELQCKVTVKGSVNIGVASVEISVEVSGPCSKIKESGTEIANMILDDVKKALE